MGKYKVILLILVFSLEGIQAQSPSIREAPRNTAANNGSTVILNCGWNNKGGNTVFWWNIIENPDVLISRDATLESGVDSTKYRIINPSTGQYNLEIKSLKNSDVGQYGCTIAPVFYIAHILRIGKQINITNASVISEKNVYIEVITGSILIL